MIQRTRTNATFVWLMMVLQVPNISCNRYNKLLLRIIVTE